MGISDAVLRIGYLLYSTYSVLITSNYYTKLSHYVVLQDDIFDVSDKRCISFYLTTLKGCQGIVFTHGVQIGGWVGSGKKLSRLYLRNHKV